MKRLRAAILSVVTLTGAVALLPANPALAGSPWLPAPGTGNIGLSYTYQTADEYYRKTSPTSSVKTVPLPSDLQQHTVMVDVNYGLLESVALDVRLGYAESYFQRHGTLREKSPSGLGDVNFGVAYRLLDETIAENELLPSLALRAGAIIAGDYDTGSINSLGDGGEGFELSGMAGKFFADRFALSGEFGYRYRNKDIPDNLFLRLSGGVLLWNRLGLSINYERIDTPWGSLDIGPGEPPGVFTPARFPEVKEEIELLSGGLTVSVTDQISLGLAYATVIAGRNTAASDVFSVSLGYSFDTYAF